MKRISEEVVARMDALNAEIGRLERARLEAVAECDRKEVWRKHGSRDLAEFLAGRYGISKWKARRWIGAARALEHLPLTGHALETGTLSPDKVVELTRFATGSTESKLIAWGKRVTPGGIRARADEETRPALREIQQGEAERRLSWWKHEHGYEIEGRLTHADGAVFSAAIDKLAADLPDLPIGDDARVDPDSSLEQRRADALVLLSSESAGGSNGAGRPTVVVHAPLEAMTTGTKSAIATDGTALHPKTAQRLSCEAHIDVVLYDRDRVVDMGRSSREPSPQLRRQVMKRDSHECAFLGCGQKRFLKVHHMDAWIPRGETKLENLITLCHTHHKLVHEQGWSVRLRGGTIPEWFMPSGRRFEPGPAPPLDAPPPPEPSDGRDPWGAFWHWLNEPRYDCQHQDSGEQRFLKVAARQLLQGGTAGSANARPATNGRKRCA